MAGVINNLGDYVLIVALSFYVYSSSRSTLLTGAMFMVQTVPPVVLGSPAGVYVDRWNKQRTLAITDLALTLVLLPLLAIHGRSLVWIAVVVAFMEACLFQLLPPAASALQTMIVEREHLKEVNALSSAGFNAAVLAGPPLGALLLGSLGLRAVVLADAASYALAGSLAMLLRVAPASQADAHTGRSILPRFWHAWASGLRLIRSRPSLRGLFATKAIANLGAGMAWVLLLVFIKGTLHGGTLQYGWWLSLTAVGGLIGAALLGYVGKRMRPHLLVPVGLAGQGSAWLMMVLLPSLPVMLALAPLMALAGVTWTVGARTLMQQNVEQSHLGRVTGAYGALGSLSVLTGLAIATPVGGATTSALPLAAIGGLELLAALVAAVTLNTV